MQKYTFKNDKSSLDYLAVKNEGKKAAIFIHGYGASMMDLYGLNQVSGNYDWYFPQGVLSLMGEMSRAWFPIDEQALQAAMMTGAHRDLSLVEPEGLDSVIELVSDFILSLPYEKIVLGGFSQGAMMSSHLVSKLKDKLDGLVLFSGNLIHKNQLVSELPEGSFPVFQSHGHQDPILSFEGAEELKKVFEAKKYQVEFHDFQGQHEIPPQVIQAWAAFMQRCQ